MTDPIWKLSLPGLPFPLADALSDLAGDGMAAVLATALDIDDEANALWRVEAYCGNEAAAQALSDILVAEAAAQGAGSLEPEVTQVEDLDWVSKSQADLAPILAGRFFVHGSHDRHRRPPNGIAIEVDAGQAFGSGHHGTTQGCLIALDRLLKRGCPRNVLDMGCGSGILAIAAARAARCQVVASDIDPVAIRVARHNIKLNAAGAFVRAGNGGGHAASDDPRRGALRCGVCKYFGAAAGHARTPYQGNTRTRRPRHCVGADTQSGSTRYRRVSPSGHCVGTTLKTYGLVDPSPIALSPAAVSQRSFLPRQTAEWMSARSSPMSLSRRSSSVLK